MTDAASSLLPPWSSFYVMTGSSAAALTGLMFIVITLLNRRSPSNQAGISTYSTPTVLHFCAALFVSAVLSAPWRSLVHTAVLIGIAGLYGIVHCLRAMHRSKRVTSYTPDFEDWTWYTILPLVAYCAIFAGAIALPAVPVKALFALAGGVILLLFIGIHNAWDVVTFIATGGAEEPPE